MKLFAKDGAELLAVNATVAEDGIIRSSVEVQQTLRFSLPEVSASFDKAEDGLLFHLDIVGAGLDGIDVMLEPDDMKMLKGIPGKGLVGFMFKALR